MNVALRDSKRFAHCSEDLLLHQVDTSNFFCDRMLDLDAFVYLQKVEVAFVIDDELHRAGIGISSHLGHTNSRLTHLLAQILELVFD